MVFIIPKEKDPYFNKKGNPSTWGITTCVHDNQKNFIKEFEYKIKDTLLHDVFIYTENLNRNLDYDDDKQKLGEFYAPDEIIITDRERYIAYEFKDLSKSKLRNINYTHKTVKAVIFHELMHVYFNQIIITSKDTVRSEYRIFRMFPSPTVSLGAEFIEEGVCEYTIYYLKENAPLGEFARPRSEMDLTNNMNKINLLYCYSVLYLQDFLDEHGLKEGIKILIRNKPPTYEEIINPELFFKRLK